MRVVNLDQIVTKRDRIIILDGKEHAMHVPTVEDYIVQMKQAEEIAALGKANSAGTLEGAGQILDLTIKTLMKSFPTITEKQFRGLNMDQLSALRMLAEDASTEDATADEGEAKGETD